ncbi:MAG: DUF3784 domain-containing protein [Peptococcaceae bacterium]|nr:DUF3784 domain-containing protein [Peptococcaceae bacterium]
MISSLTAGFVLIIAGALIWKFKLVIFMARSHPDREIDKEGLAKWIGKNMIIMGLVVSIFAAIRVLILGNTSLIVDLAIILVLSTRMSIGMAKFSKPIQKPSRKALAKEKKRPK